MTERVASPIFVGRAAELARVEGGLGEAREGRPAIFLIAGEAGVGKTRFIHEIAARAATAGTLVLEGGCPTVGGEGVPFGPIVEALRLLARRLSQAELADLLRPGRAELARLMPGVATAGPDHAVVGGSEDAGQGRLFEQLLLFLERLAADRPVLLLLEDLHWADRSTLELLSFLGRNLRAGRLMVVGTYRSDELNRRHRLMPLLAELERAGRANRVLLARFSRPEVAAQVEAIRGESAPPELVDAILARSDGNAFYAEELLASGQTQALPESLRDLLLARTARLTDPTQEFLRVAAAAGTDIAPDLMADVLGLARPEIDEALREAVADHVLVPRSDVPDERYAFRHALLQEALYDDLLPGERGRLHAGLAAALRSLAPPSSDATVTAEIAYHLQAAHDIPGAFEAWIAAGIAADDLGAVAQALASYEKALDLWERVPDAARRSPLDRVDLLRRAALLAEGPTPAKSLAFIRQATGFVDANVDPSRAGLLYERLGQYGTYTMSRDARRAAYEEGIRLVPANPPSEARAWVLSGLARFLVEEDTSSERTIPIANEAIAVAEAAEARAAQVRALAALGMALATRGDVDGAVGALKLAGEIASADGDVHGLAGVLSWTTGALYQVRRFDDAVLAGLEAEQFASEHGLGARWAAPALLWVTDSLLDTGRWTEADAVLERFSRLPVHRTGQLVLEAKLLLLDVLRGELASARLRRGRAKQLAGTGGSEFTAPGFARLAIADAEPSAARGIIAQRLAGLEVQHDVHVFKIGPLLALGIRAEADALAGLEDSTGDDAATSRATAEALIARMRSVHAETLARRPFHAPLSAAYLRTCEGEISRPRGPDPDLWLRRPRPGDLCACRTSRPTRSCARARRPLPAGATARAPKPRSA